MRTQRDELKEGMDRRTGVMMPVVVQEYPEGHVVQAAAAVTLEYVPAAHTVFVVGPGQ